MNFILSKWTQFKELDLFQKPFNFYFFFFLSSTILFFLNLTHAYKIFSPTLSSSSTPLPPNPFLPLPSLFGCCYFILFCCEPLMLIGAVFMSMGVGYFLDHMLHAGNYVTKENESSSPSNHPLPQLLKERWGLMRPAPFRTKCWWTPSSCRGAVSSSGHQPGGGYSEDKSFSVLPIHPFSHPSPHVFWGLEGVNKDVPFRALSSI